MLFNYLIGQTLSKDPLKQRSSFSRKSILTFAILANIGLLAYFKYTDFLIENINLATNSNIELLNLALPLAISFFTFQQIAYLVDSYRKETKEFDFLNYSLFVTFFPQLIAGPIVHHKEMMPQFDNIRNKVINYRNISMGVFIFSIGLFKKVVIADTFAIWASNGFDTAITLNFFEAWATSLSYTFQLYFDFSGYTDMAIGLGLLFNIKLPINFNRPYTAINIQEFWKRWHITLSRFLKDYVYIPLGGNRQSSFRTYRNIMATFILGGIWHGAGWTFIFWGLLHGVGLVIYRFWNKLGIKLWTWLAWLITFNFINIAWIFFRAKKWDDATKVLSGMIDIKTIDFTSIINCKLDNFISKNIFIPLQEYAYNYNLYFNEFILNNITFTYFFILIGFVLIMININKYFTNRMFILFGSISLVLILSLLATYLNINTRESNEFIYFQF